METDGVVQASVIQFLRQGTADQATRLIYLVGLSGLANIALIVLINGGAAEVAAVGQSSGKVQLLYVIGFALFVVAYKASLALANELLQTKLAVLRERIVDRLRTAPLRSIETLGAGELHAALAKSADQLSQNFSTLVGAAQGALLLVFCVGYVAFISLAAAVIVAVAMALGLWYFFRRRRILDAALVAVYEQEAQMLDSLTHFSAGFQELRVNRNKSDALFERFGDIVGQLEAQVKGVGGQWTGLVMFANAFLYALLGVVVFVLPLFFHGYPQEIYKIAATAIFAVGPVTGIILATPIYLNANAELHRMYALERKVMHSSEPEALSQDLGAFDGFEAITFDAVCYAYPGAPVDDAFVLGPVNLRIQSGQTIFFCGGNGAGKSTLMKLLTGLYRPTQGRICVDGQTVDSEYLGSYRALFTAIFPDLHLFQTLHGLGPIDLDKANALLGLMQLEHKVTLIGNTFSTIDLSTGQRKRLAMIAALLEDRPIYVFDEWAADQDVHFREVFYRQILPELKASGKTVLAVTHDERYWDACDVRYQVDLGQVSQISGPIG